MPAGELSPDGVPPDVQILIAWIARAPIVAGPSGLAVHERAIALDQQEVHARSSVKTAASSHSKVVTKQEKGSSD